MDKCEQLKNLEAEIVRLKTIIKDGFLVTFEGLKKEDSLDGFYECEYKTYQSGEGIEQPIN